MVRYINDRDPRFHVGFNELEEAGLLHITQRAKQLVLHHVHKIYHANADHYLTEEFRRVSNVHGYNTRHSQFNFVLPKRNSQIENSFYFNGILFWNSLPISVKSVQNFLLFKSVLKQHLKSESESDLRKHGK